METMYVIDGLITIFPSFEEADRFRKWYNKKYHTLDSDEVEYISARDIKKWKYFDTMEDAIDYSIEPTGYWY